MFEGMGAKQKFVKTAHMTSIKKRGLPFALTKPLDSKFVFYQRSLFESLISFYHWGKISVSLVRSIFKEYIW